MNISGKKWNQKITHDRNTKEVKNQKEKNVTDFRGLTLKKNSTLNNL